MRKISKFIQIFFYFFFIMTAQAESKILSIGSPDAKVTVKVFSSLTCPHCANFHSSIFNDLKKDYIDKGLVRFEHHAFPLDLAALNAEIIVRCQSNDEKKFDLLEEIYDLQQEKNNQVTVLINELKPLVQEIGDATLIVPLIKEYLEISVKNNEQLIKMAGIVQRTLQSSAGGDDLGLSEEEKNQLLEGLQGAFPELNDKDASS